MSARNCVLMMLFALSTPLVAQERFTVGPFAGLYLASSGFNGPGSGPSGTAVYKQRTALAYGVQATYWTSPRFGFGASLAWSPSDLGRAGGPADSSFDSKIRLLAAFLALRVGSLTSGNAVHLRLGAAQVAHDGDFYLQWGAPKSLAMITGLETTLPAGANLRAVAGFDLYMYAFPPQFPGVSYPQRLMVDGTARLGLNWGFGGFEQTETKREAPAQPQSRRPRYGFALGKGFVASADTKTIVYVGNDSVTGGDEAGLHARAFVEAPLSSPSFLFRGELFYNRITSFENSWAIVGPSVAKAALEDRTTGLTGSFIAALKPSARVSPYFLLGGGVFKSRLGHNPDPSSTEVVATAGGLGFGLQMGAGLSVGMGQHRLQFEFGYRQALNNNRGAAFMPLTVGIVF